MNKLKLTDVKNTLKNLDTNSIYNTRHVCYCVINLDEISGSYLALANNSWL
ncbi:MAG: hypothetical protein ACJAXS_002020 [Colwellia sp.]|jgi:hypothetical protein